MLLTSLLLPAWPTSGSFAATATAAASAALYRSALRSLSNCTSPIRSNSSSSGNKNSSNETATPRRPPNVVFFGSDLFATHILDTLVRMQRRQRAQIGQLCVVTSFSPASVGAKSTKEKEADEVRTASTGPASKLEKHRHSPVNAPNRIMQYCRAEGIEFNLWQSLQQLKQQHLQQYKNNKSNSSATPSSYENFFAPFDVGVVASFGHLIPNALIELLPHGIVNVHPSLLPRWRGASPIIFQVLFDDKQVGVSLMQIAPKHFDVGPLVDQRAIAMPAPPPTSFGLLDCLATLGSQMIEDLFSDLYGKLSIQRAQSAQEEDVTYAHKISSGMFSIDWTNQTMHDIDCHYRALSEIKPLKSILSEQVVKFANMVRLDVADLEELRRRIGDSEPCGTAIYFKKRDALAFKCKDGFVAFGNINIRKKVNHQTSKLSARDFHNGYMTRCTTLRFDSEPNGLKENIHRVKLAL